MDAHREQSLGHFILLQITGHAALHTQYRSLSYTVQLNFAGLLTDNRLVKVFVALTFLVRTTALRKGPVLIFQGIPLSSDSEKLNSMTALREPTIFISLEILLSPVSEKVQSMNRLINDHACHTIRCQVELLLSREICCLRTRRTQQHTQNSTPDRRSENRTFPGHPALICLRDPEQNATYLGANYSFETNQPPPPLSYQGILLSSDSEKLNRKSIRLFLITDSETHLFFSPQGILLSDYEKLKIQIFLPKVNLATEPGTNHSNPRSLSQGILLSSDSEKLTSMNLLMYMAPIASAALLPASLLMEGNVLAVTLQKGAESPRIFAYLAGNMTMAYLVNLMNFIVTKHTSALTLQVRALRFETGL